MVVDTNILIAYLGGEDPPIQHIQNWQSQRIVLFISSVTECEVLSYPNLSKQEEERIEYFLQQNFTAIPFEGVLARRAARIRRAVPSLKLPDAAIAALALHMDTSLVTRNVRDFQKIPNLQIISI